MPSRYRLTPEVERHILGFIRSGGFPWVAAESAGIPRGQFRRWLRRGLKSGGRSRYRLFYQNVLQARAQARLGAEVETRKHDPRFWLTHGPGREQPALPGWTNPPSGRASQKNKRRPAILSNEFLQMLGPVLEALDPYPEAREAVAQELEKLAPGKPRKTRLQPRNRRQMNKDCAAHEG